MDLSTTHAFALSTHPCPTPTISTVGGHTLALRADGTVWAWGFNTYAQIGDGTASYSPLPLQALLP